MYRTALRLFVAALVAAASLGLATHHASAQATIVLNFNGTSINDLPAINSGFGYIPPDTVGAIGPSSFAEFTNGSFSVYSNTTGALIGSRTALTTFWQNAGVTGLSLNPNTGTGTTDPHILYDPISQRWYAVTIDKPSSGANRYLVGISNSSDPTAGWKGFAITNPSSPGTFADFPMVGIDKNDLVVTTNNFNGTSGVSTGALLVPKASLLAGNISGATTIANINPNTTGFSPHPLVDFNSSSNSLDLLSAFNSTNLDLTPVLENTSTLGSSTFLTVSGNTNTQSARQPGGPNTIDTGDARFSGQVIKQGNFIWAVNTITSGGAEALRWYRIDATTNTLVESGVIGDANHDYYYGSISVNPNGDIVLGYTQSGPSEAPSSFASIGHFNGTTTTFNAPLLLQAGNGNYNLTFGGPNRWGDYSQTTLDPNDPTNFWTIQEISAPAGSFAGGTWQEQITEIHISTPSGTPEPGTLSLIIGLALSGSVCALRRRRR